MLVKLEVDDGEVLEAVSPRSRMTVTVFLFSIRLSEGDCDSSLSPMLSPPTELCVSSLSILA